MISKQIWQWRLFAPYQHHGTALNFEVMITLKHLTLLYAEFGCERTKIRFENYVEFGCERRTKIILERYVMFLATSLTTCKINDPNVTRVI